MRNGDGFWNGATPYEINNDFSKPHKQRATSKKVRLGLKARTKAKMEGGGSESARLIVELEKQIGRGIKCKGNNWYLYDKELGKWEKVEGGKQPFRSVAWDVQQLNNRNARRTNELLDCMESCKQLKLDEKFYGAINYGGGNTYLLNFSNVVLEIDRVSGEIVSKMYPKPEHMFTASLGNYWMEGDLDCVFFKKILHQVLPRKADRLLLLDFFTSALLPDSRFECALFCIGNGANGKSVITEALANAMGNDVRSAVRLHTICHGDRKFVPNLERKLINVATETDSEPISNDSLFKSIVSGELFEIDEIYKKARRMQTFVKLCFLMNNMPIFRYGTDAETRRFRIIHFGQVFDEDNRDLLLRDKLEAEKDGILSYLVRRLPRVCGLREMSYGSFISQRVLENVGRNNDMIGSFMKQCVEIASTFIPSEVVAKGNLYKIYRRFCVNEDGRYFQSYDSFFRIIKRRYPQIGSIRSGSDKKGRRYSCTNLRLTDYGHRLLS